MAGRIFINYRRDDSSGTAGRLHDRLVRDRSRADVFMDVDNIPAGADFVDYLSGQVAGCDVFLAVIGPDWLDAKDDAGHRRLDNPSDYVRVEIAAALARKIPVVPVLIDGARIPKADELPDDLKPLARRNAIEVRNTQFHRDADALADKVLEVLGRDRAAPGRRIALAGGVAALLLAGWIGLHSLGVPVWVPWRPAPEPIRPMDGAFDPSRWHRLEGVGDYKIDDGVLKVSTNRGGVLLAADDSMIRKDFTYSVRAEAVSGVPFGLAFGIQDLDNLFRFAKRAAGDYRVVQRQNGQDRVILDWTNSSLITGLRQPQVLQVVIEGHFVTLLADAKKLQAQPVNVGRQPVGSVGVFVARDSDQQYLSVTFSDISFAPRN